MSESQIEPMYSKNEPSGKQLMDPVTLYDLRRFEERLDKRLTGIDDRIDHVDDELATHIQRILLYLVLTMFGSAVVIWAGRVIFKSAMGIF